MNDLKELILKTIKSWEERYCALYGYGANKKSKMMNELAEDIIKEIRSDEDVKPSSCEERFTNLQDRIYDLYFRLDARTAPIEIYGQKIEDLSQEIEMLKDHFSKIDLIFKYMPRHS